jgi:hypothetical protein
MLIGNTCSLNQCDRAASQWFSVNTPWASEAMCHGIVKDEYEEFFTWQGILLMRPFPDLG